LPCTRSHQQNGQEQQEQQYEEGQGQQYAEGQEQQDDDQSYPSLEPAALEMVMERAEQDDELAESLRSALTIIDDCMNDYGSARDSVHLATSWLY
jgi:hypothetical protein